MTDPAEAVGVGSGSTYYDGMDAAGYRARINTPAGREDYFRLFHLPVLNHAQQRNGGGPIRVLDIACGPGFELDFLRDDPDISIIATDISPAILPPVKKRLGETALVFAGDVSHSALRPNVADAGMLVNAMVYAPDDMLGTMFNALRPGARCAVNIRLHNNLHNAAFYNHYTERGGMIVELAADRIGLDYRGCVTEEDTPDAAITKLGVQTYFTSAEGAQAAIDASGFQVVSHEPYNFPSPVNPDNQVDVFTLEKPA